jgi:hypothetical protein
VSAADPRALPWSALVEALGEERFTQVRDSLTARGTDALVRDAFLLDPAAITLLRDLVPREAPTETLHAYGALLHALYLCWDAAFPVRSVSTDRLRLALGSRSPLPAPRSPLVCYVQLPERLCWAEPAPGEAHEPLDGMFVSVRGRRLAVVAVLGFRPERGGFTTIEAELDLPLELPPQRSDGRPAFAPVLPGGDRAQLLSVVDAHELAALALKGMQQGAGSGEQGATT